MNRIKQWLKYYRASLIDGAVKPKNNIFESCVDRKTVCLERMDSSEIKGLQSKCDHKLFLIKDKNGDKEIEWATIQIAPVFIVNEFDHTKNRDGDSVGRHYPFWISARVNKEGTLQPPVEGEIPTFMRPYLAPNPQELPIIAEMDKLDEVLSSSIMSVSNDNWLEYWASCEAFFKNVTGKDFQNFHKDKVRFGFCVYGDLNTTRNIRNLYDQLLDESCEPENELMQILLSEKEESRNKELNVKSEAGSRRAIYLNKNHYGQMRCDFPLSRSQRAAFAEYLEDVNNKVFAVNGPPGTGKTTLLQSIIANNVVMPVLNAENPMLMIGCSTNNQAITNILDSMQFENDDENDILSKRWLPDVSAFGLYLTSSQNNRQEQKNYQQATSNFLNDGFLGCVDQKDRAPEFEIYFIDQTVRIFGINPDTKLTKVKKILKEKIEAARRAIDDALDRTASYEDIPETLKSHGFESKKALEDKISEIREAISDEKDFCDVLNRITEELSGCYNGLPFFIKYLPFGFCKRYRSNKFQLIIDPIAEHVTADLLFHKYFHIVAEVDRLKLESSKKLADLTSLFERLSTLRRNILQREENYRSIFNSWTKEHQVRWEKIIKKASDYNDLPADEITAAKLDVSYRYDLFWLCVHYREAEYIEAVARKTDGSCERSEREYKQKLRRLARITPLFISTFHSLPRFSNYYGQQHGETYYRDLYDLMIVDEAGQVAPEVAVASFALTKKILAVGDVNQIEPVSGVTDRVDFINAQKYGLLTTNEQFDALSSLGFMASECSLMQLVKKSCPYRFTFGNGKTDKGAYLLEHYRCLDDIIRYSNDYVYNGCLDLLGGRKHNKSHSLPPMGYIHVNGTDEQNNGSRQNDLEARVIAEWLFCNYKSLEDAYGKDIGEVLAVIAPFAAQIRLIRKYTKERLGEKACSKLTIGTVHSLQGAGREVVLFSTVYGKYNGRMFFDLKNKYNMLNVATTRAKHSFIVFGNMQIFQPHQNTPSGNLAKVLFSREEYNLDQEFIYSSEKIYRDKPTYKVMRIATLDKHRKCLRYCFEEAEKRLLIFSPFISEAAIIADGVTALIKTAIERGVCVKIITDEYLDMVNGRLKDSAEAGRNILRKAGAKLIVYKGIHNKTICVDDKLLIEGSFNWLSSVRDENSPYCRKETSVMLQGEGVNEMINTILGDFKMDDL